MDVFLFCIQVDTLLFAVAQGPAQAVELWRKQNRLAESSSVSGQEVGRTKRNASRRKKESGLSAPIRTYMTIRIHSLISKYVGSLDVNHTPVNTRPYAICIFQG